MNQDLQSVLQAFLRQNPDLPESNPSEASDVSASVVKPAMRLDIVLERKGRAGKTATIISGFDGTDTDLQQLASTVKRTLGTGGSARGGEILIQGDRRDDIFHLLTKLGYKARII